MDTLDGLYLSTPDTRFSISSGRVEGFVHSAVADINGSHSRLMATRVMRETEDFKFEFNDLNEGAALVVAKT